MGKIDNEIELKVLDMSWDYYKLLAQQRVTHFNLFIIIIGATSAVVATQIFVNLRGNMIALASAVAQLLLCFIFYKIDIRNKFLIKHNERIIKNYESRVEKGIPQIFITEEKNTKDIRMSDKDKIYLFRQLSISQLYNLFFSFFAIVSLFEGCLAIFLIFTE
ncbi:membrane protein of unknown function [Petrocella atlantisensis]|uniref:SMODS and SLOG-associating 2TM effector domain-containing protein n=1 Tax=Petrocella atlantisensis TaxID=2173034 RepID=A0A3P7RYS9_9FIRM|nr:hypothetical protein [Petrocella atlantisensis]VDN47896.1 membrane protein of unknown function [Petrocella atlantisensis]